MFHITHFDGYNLDMARRRFAQSIALLMAALFAWPAMGRWVVACADGTPCRPAVVGEEHPPCCAPEPCHEPADRRCIVKTTPAPDRVAPDASPAISELLPLAILPTATPATPPPAPTVTLAVEQERPPNLPPPKQGHSPRAPPAGRV